jgi:hypothetical protein
MKWLAPKEISEWLFNNGQIEDPYLGDSEPRFRVQCNAPVRYSVLERLVGGILGQIITHGDLIVHISPFWFIVGPMREQNAAVEFNGGPVPLWWACPGPVPLLPITGLSPYYLLPITYYAPIPLAQILLPNRADSLVS